MAAFVPARLLIFGATGAIGKYITESILAAKPAFEHVAIFTSTQTATTKPDLLSKWKASGLASVVVGDVTSEADVSHAYQSEKPDTVISALGRGAITVQEKVIELADKSESVKWVFPSEYGTDIEHNAKSPNEKPHQNKLAIRKYIRENIKNVKVTYLVTGPYFDMWVNAAPGLETLGGFDVTKKLAYLIDNGEGSLVGFTTMWDVGKFLVASLRHPEASFGKALKVQSFVVKPKDVLAEYEKQTGSKWTVQSIPLQELKDAEAKLYAENNPKAVGATLRRIWAEGGTLYEKNDNELIGVGPGDTETLETAVRRALST